MPFETDVLNRRIGSPPHQHWLQRLHIDWPLLAGLLALSGAAMVILYSAGGQKLDVVLRQAGRLGLALGVMTVIAQIHPRHLRAYSPVLYGLGALLLAAVMVMGETSLGAQRWLNLGVVRFQPSEMTKLSTPMMLAWFMATQPVPPRFRQVLVAGVLILLPTLMIAKQPDLGTAFLVGVAGAAVLFLAGLRWAYIAALAALGGALLPVMWHLMHDYQRDRVLMFLNPEADPLGRGYHIIQSKIAIGSGGLYGKGWLQGTQSHLEFLPERSTDFIFAVFAEEFGLLGCLGLLGIYLFILGRCFYIVVQAQDKYARLLSGALTVTFFVYIFVNTGMVIGILPVVGVPLPLVSYGGTSMVTLLAGFGILMSIQTHNRYPSN
ncbi:rod shape-determining protein RodA [Methylococcus sp. EFPC2]|uniref:rod shape-determining protein RodA n=1 Tax=Methylococcus sp. EFPC2 TaxID=2812648 RepID=UPI00196717F2|nr:rod shape-determining protein RodA [Methylococcus sp. EFPC2]QSA96135.1 rod shape-determining protein RodA [Methylococcus sp. EFPC2]